MSISVTFVDHDGTSHTVSASPDLTLMEAAVSNLVPGIEAECGGACACATCHVLVLEDWLSRLPDKSEMEIAMLEFVVGKRENSRLSCQICLSNALHGLTVVVPGTQR